MMTNRTWQQVLGIENCQIPSTISERRIPRQIRRCSSALAESTRRLALPLIFLEKPHRITWIGRVNPAPSAAANVVRKSRRGASIFGIYCD